MFFRPFSASIKSPVEDEATFVAEYWISQILATSDPGSLRRALDEGRLPDVLLDELEFYGQIPKARLPQVRAYVLEQYQRGHDLCDIARRLVAQPRDEILRQQVITPIRPAPSIIAGT